MEVVAKLIGVRVSPRKLQLVANQIRGCRLDIALSAVSNGNTKSARIVEKLLNSAIANAENNYAADIDELAVSYVVVNQGQVLKRLRQRAKGRADRILKRSSHIEIRLSDR
jgi:large subunit ribosomal protein L22